MPNVVALLVGVSIIVSIVAGGIVGWMIASWTTFKRLKRNGLTMLPDGTIVPSPERIEALMEAIKDAVVGEEEIRGRDNYRFN